MNVTKPGRLRRTWQRLRTVPGLGRDVGVLAGLVVVGVVAATLLLSQEHYIAPWSDKVTFAIEFQEAVAVSPGNGQEVDIAGVPVGVITKSEATSRNTSLVTVAIDPGHPIYDNARAVLRPENPLNEMYISLEPGGPPGNPLPPGGMIPVTQTSRPVQVEEVLDHLDERSRLALSSLLAESDNAPQTVPGGLAASQNTMVALRPVVAALAQRRDNIRQLVTALAQIGSAAGGNDARLISLVNSTQQTLGVLAVHDDQLQQTLGQLPGFSSDLRKAMSSTTSLTTQLNPTLDDLHAAAAQLPGALQQLGATADQVNAVAQAARPVVANARPVVSDLRPVVDDLNATFGQLEPVTRWADYATAQVAPWMYDLAAFVYNTSSIFSVADRQGGLARAQLSVSVANPTAVDTPTDATTNTFRDGGSPLGHYPAPGQGGSR
jgi:phospholipid/cholesterol/gamma-HCH transport system substrate-binding protein